MAKKEDGIWRTIGGRHIFIRDGQSVSEAMKASGKYPSAKKNKKQHLTDSDEDREIKGRMDELKREIDSRRNDKEKTDRLRKEYEEYLQNYDYEKEMPEGAKFSKMLDEAGAKGIVEKEKENKGLTELGKQKVKELNKDEGFQKEFNKFVEDAKSKEARPRDMYEYMRQEEIVENAKREWQKLDRELMDYEDDPVIENSPAHDELRWKVQDAEDNYRHELHKYESMQKEAQDDYETKVYGSDVRKADARMKEVFGDDFKYKEDIDAELEKQVRNRIMAEKTLNEQYNYSDRKGKEALKAEFNNQLKKQQELEKKYGKISEEDFKRIQNDQYKKVEDYKEKQQVRNENKVNEPSEDDRYEKFSKDWNMRNGFYDSEKEYKEWTKEIEKEKSEVKSKINEVADRTEKKGYSAMEENSNDGDGYSVLQNKVFRQAYNEYMKEHPNSKLSFNQFKKYMEE